MIRVIGFKDIYSAWESQVISIIDEYLEDDNQGRDAKSKYVQAIQTEFIVKAPKVLCLQLNRVDYQNEKVFKHKNKVEIYKQIELDRFMIQNQEKSQLMLTMMLCSQVTIFN